MRSFASDYRCKPHPAVVEAVMKACADATDRSYGEDKITRQATEILAHHFGGNVAVFFVSNGTAANRLALQTVLQHPFSAVICTDDAHINTTECGAIESLGYKLLTMPLCRAAKINPLFTDCYLAQRRDIHLTYPQVLSISNATELGAVYSLDELRLIGDFAKEKQLALHIDGARLSNAAAHLGVNNLAEISLAIGADAVTLGGTKNGGMMGDAVIFRNPDLAEIATRLHKQQGQLGARMQCIAAQFTALFTDDLWLKNARNANAMAALLAERCQRELGITADYPMDSNAVFVALPREIIPKLLEETDFYTWNENTNTVRWMCAWDTTEEEVDALIKLVKRNLK